MIKVLASIMTTALIIAMTLGAMFILVRATVYVTSLESPIERAVAMGAELLLGVVLLLGTTWLATHLAVRIFGPKDPPPLPSFDIPSKVPSQAPSHGGPVV